MSRIPERMIVLWMSELPWTLAGQIPAVEALRRQGATVTTLLPLPITGQQSQTWQMFSGQNPGRTGYFDSWMPQQYITQSVVEPTIQTLHDVIIAAGRTVTEVNLAMTEVPTYLKGEIPPVDCLIVHTIAGNDIAIIGQAITAVQTWAGTDGICLLLSDYHPAAVKSYVNLNNGLCDLGLVMVSEHGTICWEDSLAYHVGHGQLWINLEGREPAGMVAAYEYDQVCQALISSLPTKLLDPQSGETLIERIYRRDELYKGDYVFQAPDLIVVLRSGYAPSPNSISLGFDDASIWPAPTDTYTTAGLHPITVAGLVIAVGAPFAAGQTITQAPLMDVAPTLLHALQLPMPRNMDAEVITGLFKPAYMHRFPVRWAEQNSSLSREDEEEIVARLKSLGYVE